MAKTKARSPYLTELDSFSYDSNIHRHLCNNITSGTLTADDEDELSTNETLILATEWCRSYYNPDASHDLMQRIKNWFAAGRLDIDEICVLTERGRLSFRDVLAQLWPVYYEYERKGGAQAYEALDIAWLDKVTTAFQVIISHPAAENAAAEHRVKEKFAAFDDEWGAFRPLRPMPPEIPIDGFPPVLQEYIREVSKYGEVGESMVTGLVLGILGAAVSGTIRLELTNGHTEPLNPAVLVLADSGGRKTSTLNLIRKPLQEIEKTLMDKDTRDAMMRKIRIDDLDKEISGRTRSTKPDPSAPKKSVSELAAESKELDSLRFEKMILESENKSYRTVIANITPEELGNFIARSWSNAAAMISDDTNLFNQVKDLYGGSGDKQDIYLTTISGGSYTNDRRGSATYSFDQSALSVVVMYQDDRFESLMKSNPDLTYSGFIPRLCVVYAPKMAGYMQYRNNKLSASVQEAWRTVIHRIKNDAIDYIEGEVEQQIIENREKATPTPLKSVGYRTIKSTESGESIFYDWIRAREPLRRAGEEHSAISSWASKSNNRALVFAALFTLVDDPHATAVSSAYVRTGIAIENALTEHALYAAETSSETRAGMLKDLMVDIANDLEEKHGMEEDFVWGVIPAGVFNQKIKNVYWIKSSSAKGGATSAAKEYLQLLETYGHVRHVQVANPSGRGAPKKFWMLRPEGL
ncbi:hypothetical protein PP301_gp090 [Gordonia phage GMA2]|uniref:DUF3987 domain-containing protein n=1 Tax=Gordonia phage GMA2 TaxID=1647283 RepID=A0A0K0N7B1_9CAUD|nr:hypothetical protein PP301_gp090 [Gordonia phage GMA2]AKJ72632.1 hypothetical protein GMA2_94 [Gordonia phage GMA2]